MRLDSHQHFWDLTRFDYAWMPPPASGSVLRRNYLPGDLKPILKAHNFDGCIVVQASSVIGETHWLLELAEDNDFVRGVVGWVDLTSPTLGDTLDALMTNPKFRGVRHIVHDEPDLRWLLQAPVIAGLRELERRNLPYDLLLRPPHLSLIPQLADKVPSLRFVLDHISKPLIKDRMMEPWARDMEVVAQIPGMHCKLSGMITEADHENWKADDLRPYVQHVLKLFPPERLMFGSDWPVCLLAGTWKAVLAAFTQACGPLPQTEREQILGGTAAKFYGIE